MASELEYQVRSSEWLLTINGVDVTTETSEMVLGISYIDRLSAASGEVEIEVEDGERRWQGSWYPSLGDRIDVQLGYRGEQLIDCGNFELDELALDGPPDTMRLRGLASYVTPAMRTRSTAGYENQTVTQIARRIAAKYDLEFVAATGGEETEIGFGRITQRLETDLEFLKRLAVEHGYDFSVRGSQLVFYSRAALMLIPAAGAISRPDVTRFSFKSRSRRIYGAAQVSYFEPNTRELIVGSATARQASPGADALRIVGRCENAAQASVKAQAALELHNAGAIEMRIEGPGKTTLVAGNNVLVEGWKALDGIYQIETARHRIDRTNGYTTCIRANRIGDANL